MEQTYRQVRHSWSAERGIGCTDDVLLDQGCRFWYGVQVVQQCYDVSAKYISMFAYIRLTMLARISKAVWSAVARW
jgi:hypothetical protein